jgi:hypothetical protein
MPIIAAREREVASVEAALCFQCNCCENMMRKKVPNGNTFLGGTIIYFT